MKIEFFYFANWLNDKLTWEIKPIKVMGKTIFKGTTINLGKIPTFATGGYPNTEKPFIVGENGAEIMGGDVRKTNNCK